MQVHTRHDQIIYLVSIQSGFGIYDQPQFKSDC